MVRTLAKIAGVSSVIAIACFALALAIGGPELRQNGFHFDDGRGQSYDDHGRPATGKLRDHTNFTGVDAGGGIRVSVAVGPVFKVEIVGDHPEQIDTRLEGTELRIRPHGHGFWWGSRDLPAVHVEMPALDAIQSSAGAQVAATGINSGNLSLHASSGAQIDAAGTCRTVALKASSGAQLDAGNLACDSGQVDASSGADLKVRVSGKLDVDASSGANVRNLGPSKTGNVSLSSGANLHNE